MPVQQRRVLGLLVTILLIAAISSYAWWRMSAVSRDGWAGFAYMPDIKGSSGKAPPSFAGYRPGMVFMVYPGSPGERGGIQRTMRVIAVNGIPVRDLQKITSLSRRLHAGDVLTYRVEWNGKIRDIRVRFDSPIRTPMLLAVFATTVVVSLTYLIIGIFVFWRLPTDSRSVVFFIMTLIAAASFVATIVAQFEGQSMRGLVVDTKSAAQLGGPITIAVVSMFFAPLLLHLALIFPKPRPVVARGRTLFTWIYGVPIYCCVCLLLLLAFFQFITASSEASAGLVIVILLWSVTIIIAAAAGVSLWRLGGDMRRRGVKEGFIAHPLGFMTVMLALVACATFLSGRAAVRAHSPVPFFALTAFMILVMFAAFASYPVATLIALFRSYRSSGLEERRQVKWPLWATMLVVAVKLVLVALGVVVGLLIAFSNLPIPSAANFVADIAGRLLYILIPLSFAFAILKYRLMNIDVIIRRTVLYTILSAIVFVLYGVLVAGVGTLLIRFARVQNTTMVIASTIVVALVTVPLRNRLQQVVDRNLFRERRDYPLALRNISNAIGSSEIDAFLRYAAEQVQQAMQTRFVAIALRSEEHFVIAAKVGLADELVGRVRIPVGRVGEPVAHADAVPPELRRLGAVVVVPVSVHREPLGLVASGSKLSDQQINGDDLEFLNSAASQIALSIENSRLRTEEAEFAQARAIQQVLLPTAFPRLDGFSITGKWLPARSVAGDYFDTLALGDGKVALCIGDVAGKGMPAALLMANLQAAVKATAGPDVAPSQLCEKVKRVVGDNLAGGKFISFFYGVLHAPTHTLTYTNAGHNPAILARAGGEIERLGHGGPAFCRLFRDDPHEQATVTLAPGDRLVLFTDGASEARRNEEDFGEDRLAAFISAHRAESAEALMATIIEELTAFTSGNFSDDVTLVVVAAE